MTEIGYDTAENAGSLGLDGDLLSLLKSNFDQKTAQLDLDPESIRPKELITKENILEIWRRGIGLRVTGNDRVQAEVEEGVYGDFLTIFNIGGLLEIKEEGITYFLNNYQRLVSLMQSSFEGEGSIKIKDKIKIIEMCLRDGEFDKIGNFGQGFVDKFIGGIKNHLKNSILMNFSGYFSYSDKVARIFEADTFAHFPALVIVEKGENKGIPYDLHRYPPFGKNGRSYIIAGEINGSIVLKLDDPDIVQLKEKYREYLNFDLSNKIPASGMEMTLLDAIEEDIMQIYVERLFVHLFTKE